MDNFWPALALTTGAGMATAVGSLIALAWKRPGPRYMAFTLGFSAGVMIHVSYVELLQGGVDGLAELQGSARAGFLIGHAAFFAGMVAMLLIDVLVSHTYILEEPRAPKETPGGARSPAGLRRASILVALGIGIHNFPEGMATFVSAMQDMSLGVSLAVAIALHNIPEGIAVAVPVYAATGSSRKAFCWSLLSGLSEPVGALLAALVLMPILNAFVLAIVLCVVGGFMVYIAFDELLPVASSYGQEHVSIVGVLLGMAVMTASLALF